MKEILTRCYIRKIVDNWLCVYESYPVYKEYFLLCPFKILNELVVGVPYEFTIENVQYRGKKLKSYKRL